MEELTPRIHEIENSISNLDSKVSDLGRSVSSIESMIANIDRNTRYLVECQNFSVGDLGAINISGPQFSTPITINKITFTGFKCPKTQVLKLKIDGWGNGGGSVSIELNKTQTVPTVTNVKGSNMIPSEYIYWDSVIGRLRIRSKGQPAYIYINNGYLLSVPIECPLNS